MNIKFDPEVTPSVNGQLYNEDWKHYFINFIKYQMQCKIEENEQRRKELKVVTSQLSSESTDGADRGSLVQSRQMLAIQINRNDQRMKELEFALDRINVHNTFAICYRNDDGEVDVKATPHMISVDKLLTNPAATCCKKHVKAKLHYSN